MVSIASLAAQGDGPNRVTLQKSGPASLLVDAPRKEGQIDIALADLLDITLLLEVAKEMEVELPTPLSKSAGWKVNRVGKWSITDSAGGKQIRQAAISFEPLAPGENPLQIEPVRYRLPMEEWEIAAWQPIAVKVTSSITDPDPKKLRDAMDIEGTRLDKSAGLIWWLGGLAAVVGLSALGFFLLRRGRRFSAVMSSAQIAVRDLDRILALRLPEKGEFNRFHTFLANLVRRHLEKTRHLPARRQTTAEFLQTMKESAALSGEEQDFLRAFMERSDLAKFAGARATVEECHQLAEQVRAWIARPAVQGEAVLAADPPAPGLTS